MTEPFTRPGADLCVVSLTYGDDIGAIDAAMGAHVDWLSDGYANGVLLASGRKQPRTGGVIIAIGNRAEVEALIANDPFVSKGLASAEIIPFTASMAATPLADLLSS
jgi:uncharacterized protein YciI